MTIAPAESAQREPAALAPAVGGCDLSAADHLAQFYEDDAFLMDRVADFLGPSLLAAAGGAMAVVTATHRVELDRRLQDRGIDVADCRGTGRYLTIDAEELLEHLLSGGCLKRPHVAATLEPMLAAAVARCPPLRVFGEMVGLLCVQGQHQMAVDLEQAWNEVARRHSFALLCGYPLREFGDRTHTAAMLAVCNAHQRVIPAESYSSLNTESERLLAIAQLQQKSRALECEVRARKTLERALREEAHTLETLNRVGAAVAAELDLERVVQVVTDAATELSGAAFGAFFYNSRTANGESYRLCTLSGAPREAFGSFPMPRNTGVFAPTFAGEQVVRSDDITHDLRYGRNAPHQGVPTGHLPVRSYLAVPVVSRAGEVIGGLFFGHPEVGVFTERAERLVTGIASQAAAAIDNARLYRAACAPLCPR